MKAFVRGFVPVVLVTLAAACGGDSHAVGTYELDVEALIAQIPQAGSMPAEGKEAMKAMMSGSIELKADHSARFVMVSPMGGADETGTWALAGDQLTVTGTSDGKEESKAFTLRGGVITAEETGSGQTMAMTFRKK